MHDQLRDMGRRIVCEQSPKEPEKRSRLWSREEVIEVLEEHKVRARCINLLLLFYITKILIKKEPI